MLIIRRDGTLIKKMIEKKSGNHFYDQFVMKTIQNSLPLPSFPALMPQKTIEIGIKFLPGKLMM